MDQQFMTPEKPCSTFKKMVAQIYSPSKQLGSSSKPTDSPFQNLGNHSTPPSRFLRIRNPFEAALANRLHLPVWSPSVLKQSSTKVAKCDKFRWSIENVALLNPAQIDEQNCNQFYEPEDPEIETTAHQNIEKFFSEATIIVPSPFEKPKATPLLTSIVEVKDVECRDSACQTILTFPPTLPEHVQNVLAPYFSFTANQQSTPSDINTSLTKRLFHFSNESIDEDDPNPVPQLSPFQSPVNVNKLGDRPVDNVLRHSPCISPIRSIEDGLQFRVSDHITSTPSSIFKADDISPIRSNFKADMSIDVVPDSENLPENLNYTATSLIGEEEDCTYSSVNWDIEDRSIQNVKKIVNEAEITSDSVIKMDISSSSFVWDQSKRDRGRKELHRRALMKKYSKEFDDSDLETDKSFKGRELHRRSLIKKFSLQDDEEKENVSLKRRYSDGDFNDGDTGYNTNLSVTSLFTNTNLGITNLTSTGNSNITNVHWQTNYFSSTSTPTKRS